MVDKIQLEKGKGKTKQKKIIENKLARLSILASEFLEKTFNQDSLASDWDEMIRLKNILWDNLWKRPLDPDDPDTSDDIDEPNWIPKPAKEFAETILEIHRLLTEGFWHDFKKQIKHLHEKKTILSLDKSKMWPAYYKEYRGLIDWASLYEQDIPIKIAAQDSDMSVRFYFDGDSIHFYRSQIDAIPALLNLLQGLTLDRLYICKNETCNIFFKRDRRDHVYCCNNCGAVQSERKKREKDREAYNKKQVDYYHMRKKREEEEKKIRRNAKIIKPTGKKKDEH